jgi:hypothetical protein
VRLSPKSIFFGIVLLGLPLAVAAGWMAASPATRPAADRPIGAAGGIGAAPARGLSSRPNAVADHESPAATLSVAPSPTGPAPVPPGAVPVSAGPTATASVSFSPLPTLTLPPVPTPTSVTSSPTDPTSGPPSSAPVESGDPGILRLSHGG